MTIIFSRSSLNNRNVFGLPKVVFPVEDRLRNPGSHLSPMIAFDFLTFNNFVEFKDHRWDPRSSLVSKIVIGVKDCILDLESQKRSCQFKCDHISSIYKRWNYNSKTIVKLQVRRLTPNFLLAQ